MGLDPCVTNQRRTIYYLQCWQLVYNDALGMKICFLIILKCCQKIKNLSMEIYLLCHRPMVITTISNLS